METGVKYYRHEQNHQYEATKYAIQCGKCGRSGGTVGCSDIPLFDGALQTESTIGTISSRVRQGKLPRDRKQDTVSILNVFLGNVPEAEHQGVYSRSALLV